MLFRSQGAFENHCLTSLLYGPLLTKVCIAKAMVFPVVVYGSESWTRKKAECQIIDAFELDS